MSLTRTLEPANGAPAPAPPSPPSGMIKNGSSRARERMRMILAVLGVLNAVLLLLIVRPLGRSLAQRQEELTQSRARYDRTIANVRQMRDLESKLQSAIQNDRKFSGEHFLDRRTAFSSMVTDLEKLAMESQLRPVNVTYQLKEDPKRPGFLTVGVTVVVEGGYPDLVRFINKLEQSRLFWIIGGLNVTNSAGRGLRMSLQMETFSVSS